jgi:hypothetical protein
MLVGIVQGAYGLWSSFSDVAAAKLYRSSESCEMNTPDSAAWKLKGACRLELAVVYDRHSHSSRSRTNYYLLTVSRQGAREVTPLFGPGSGNFWARVSPTERIMQQRFVAPGYHLTGHVTAFADSAGWVITGYHPDSLTRYGAANGFIGALTFATGLALLVRHRTVRSARLVAATA